MANTDADRIRWLLRRFNLSKGALAASVGYSAPYISEITHDKKRISRELAIKLAGQYGVSLDWLLTGGGAPYGNAPTTTPAEPEPVRAVPRTFHVCDSCQQPVPPKAERCPHCSVRLVWGECPEA